MTGAPVADALRSTIAATSPPEPEPEDMTEHELLQSILKELQSLSGNVERLEREQWALHRYVQLLHQDKGNTTVASIMQAERDARFPPHTYEDANAETPTGVPRGGQ
jgi:predicted RNase H-like nuclease (RuvC/YqgF family)